MKTIPSLATAFAIYCLVAGIAAKSVFLIGGSSVLLLLMLPALLLQIYWMTPAYKRKCLKEMKEFNIALKCIDDLAELNKNKSDENIAQFKSKWPNFYKQITSNDIVCKVAAEKGVWELFNELAEKVIQQQMKDDLEVVERGTV